jgi:hypothetical protein
MQWFDRGIRGHAPNTNGSLERILECRCAHIGRRKAHIAQGPYRLGRTHWLTLLHDGLWAAKPSRKLRKQRVMIDESIPAGRKTLSWHEKDDG